MVAPVRALLQPLVAGLGDLEPVAARRATRSTSTDVVERLAAAAYTRVDLVERRGEFAVRGGILDVFPPTEEHPLRVEFWGDTVEEVRWFTVADQRSLEIAEHGLWAPPCRELLLTDEVRARAARAGGSCPAWPTCSASSPRASPSRAWSPWRRRWSTAWSCCSTCCPAGTPRGRSCDPERVRTRAHDLVATSAGVPRRRLGQRRRRRRRPRSTCGACSATVVLACADVARARADRALPWWTLTPFATRRGARRDLEPTTPTTSASVTSAPRVEPLPRRHRRGRRRHRSGWLSDGWRVVVVTEGHGPGRAPGRACWREPTSPAGSTRPVRGRCPSRAWCTSTHRPRSGTGFVARRLRLGAAHRGRPDRASAARRTKDMRRMPSRRRNVVDPLQLRPGDYVVHEQHGVGRFVEMVQRTVPTRPASTWSSSTPRASAASPATGCSCPATRSTR